MADCSRPPHNQPRSVFGFRSKGAYDDVFVARPKVRAPTFTPGVKDYAEIFNCSSSKPSSIPVLDLDEFHKREADDEVLVDYGNVFGGFTDAKIGFAYEDVFSVAAGVSRRANDSHSHSGGTDRSTAVEYSQKLPHESLWEKKHSMSSGETISGVKGDSDERYGLGRLSKGPVPASPFDGTVPLKKASVSRSDTTTNNLKQYGDELPVGKHSRSVSSSGLPKHGGDRFIEIDNRSRNGSGSDKSISSNTQMETNIIRPKVQMSEATAATDSSLHLGGSMSTYSDVYRQNAHGEGHSGSNNSLEGLCVRSMHGLDKPFKKDDNEDESVVKRNAVTSNLFLDLTHEHGSAHGTPKLAAGNSIALNSHGSVNAKGDNYCNSLRDVKFQVVNGSRGPSVKYSQPDASVAAPHERSDSAPATQSQQSFSKMNIAIEGKENPEVTISRDVGSGGTHKDSNGHLSNGVVSKNEVDHVGAAKIKTSTSKIDVSKRSTYLSANNSPCSSDDGIDKHSEASVSAAAVRKAIKEAQALINVAKESNGVKGFMSLAMARKSGQVKVTKEEHDSKVNENPKKFEAAQAKIQNNLSTSAANSAPRPIGSEMKMTSADMVIERSNQGTEFSTFNKPDQIKAVEMQSSLRKKTQESASTVHALPKINSFQEKLAVYSSIMDQKLAPRTEDVTLPGIVAGSEKIRIFPEADCLIVPNVEKREAEVNSASQEVFLNKSPESPRKDAALLGIVAGYGQIRIVPKADCSIVPNVEKRETEVTSASEEAFHNNSPQSPRIEDVALPGIVAGSGQIRIVLEAGCSIMPNVVKGETKANSADKEVFLNRSPESYTGAEKEFQKAMNSRNQGSKMQSFHDDIVKQDAVAATEHIDSDRNEAIKVESEDHASSDLTSLEEENVEESELDPHDQVLDTEDTDSQDYASAEENWVPSDTDDEISEKDHHFSAEKNLGEIDEMENMVVPEVPVTSEDTLPPSLNNIHHDQIVKETDDVQLQNILMKEALVSDEMTAPVVNNSDENPVVEETDKNEDISLQITVKRDAKVTSEEVTAAVLKEDLIVEEADGSENGALHNMVIHDHEVKFSSEKTTVPFFNYADEDPIVEEADISEESSVLFIVSPRTKITSEDGASSCFNSANRDTGVEIEGTVDMTEQTMSNHEAIIISENTIAPIYDKSNEDQIVVDDGDDTTSESSVGFQNEHEDLSTEMLECAARVETESAFCTDPESLHLEGSEVELISTDDLAEESAADAIEESRSMPWTFEPQYQERDDKNSRDPDLSAQQDREELLDDAGLEADATEEGHETMNVRGSENNNVTVDAAGNEDATETESTSWDSKHVNSEPEAEVQFFEPLPDSIKHKETTEVEQLSENHIQLVERQERRKWDISRETFELPELEIGVSDIQDTMKQDSNEIERQMDRHGRKKWEIPRENFELPVLGDEVVEENEENVGHDTEGAEGATQSAEKPERKKWKIQKQVFEVPILCAEAVQDPPDHEGFVIKTLSSEEMGMTHSLNTVTLPEEMVRHEEVYDEFSTNAEAVPGDAASCELCSENSEEIAKESVPKIIMSSEEEPCKQMEETFSQQDSKVDEGKAVEQEDRMKGTDDVNVKDEIKRTLGMLWKKIYNIKQDEASESVELTGKENVNVNDTIGQGITKDLNLKGPVQLVESPRQQDNTETLNFSGNRKGNEDSFESPEAFEVNESSIHKCRDSVSMETREVQRNSPLAFDSNKYQEGEKRSDCVENENYNANHPESQSEEALSGSESENCTEMAPTHEACDLKKEGIRTCNIPPSNVYEHRERDSETASRSNDLMVDESLVDNAESTHKTNVLQQDGLNDVHDDISDENLSETEVEMHHVDDLSDKRCTDSEQHNTNTSRHNMKSVSDSDAPDVTPSHGFEQMSDKKETCTDKIEQASNWKWIFGDGLKDKSNKQDEAHDLKKFGEVKGKTKETANDNVISHISGKVKIDGDKPTLMNETVPNCMHKEVTPDQEVVKNLKRAKELEKIVVERAIREARERAFIEARERAAMERANAVARETSAKEKTNLESQERIALERANAAQVRERAAADRAKADAHQKVNSDGRERSQRTSSESKLSSERNSLEVKRKAELERAAVERATTEARQRALEKAMSRKEQVTESSSRSASTSSDEYGSASKERLNEEKPSESALRFKARNERHQRIAERAAKALAEKNMRDLLVQREQAERNRLAEVLDADVKRWARGKTGNLRALLSTLQYILGPDSGWQAIHLTEIVTADAVKKAYRKATLFVHPDKLQQRGATIRQKYICEKVFDLLKEAWNKFDRDER